MSNIEVVQGIYEALGRGDLPAILDQVADVVDWEYAYRTAPNDVPWLQPRDDKAGIEKFFESLVALEIHSFTPKTLLEGPGLVVALCDIDFTVKKTGKRVVEVDEAHIWHFNDEGKVVRFRHCADTHQNLMACKD